MVHIKRISIAEPCDQLWQQMARADSGRRCEQCCKTVIDFAHMTNDEIITYFSSANNVCGRFYDGQLTQLNDLLILSKHRNKWWKHIGLATFVALLFSTIKVDAQVKKSITTHKSRSLIATDTCKNVPVKPDSLYVKTLTPAQISIDTTNNNDAAMKIKIPETPFLMLNVLGGVQVQGIKIEDSKDSFYSLLRGLFR